MSVNDVETWCYLGRTIITDCNEYYTNKDDVPHC